MKLAFCFTLFWSVAILVSCTSVNDPFTEVGMASQAQLNHRRILVNFAETQARILKPIGPPGTSYRIRHGHADWKASPHVRQLKSAVEDDYDLEATDEWPIEILGVFCVVYDVPGDKEIDRLIEQLDDDLRVQSVQRLYFFGSLTGRQHNH